MLAVLCRVGQCIGNISYQLVGSNVQFFLYGIPDNGKMQNVKKNGLTKEELEIGKVEVRAFTAERRFLSLRIDFRICVVCLRRFCR
jgi:hypothetical protein